MGVSNYQDDHAERNRGYNEVPLSTVIPQVGNTHLQQNPISDSYNLDYKSQMHLTELLGPA